MSKYTTFTSGCVSNFAQKIYNRPSSEPTLKSTKAKYKSTKANLLIIYFIYLFNLAQQPNILKYWGW